MALRTASRQAGPAPEGAGEDDPRRVLAETVTYVENNRERMKPGTIAHHTPVFDPVRRNRRARLARCVVVGVLGLLGVAFFNVQVVHYEDYARRSTNNQVRTIPLDAPRGILYHRYDLDADGTIRAVKIVPPTSQNQAQIEDDLGRFVQPRVHLPVDELTWQCEQAIRNYDPCISCATHFLRLELERA